MFYWSNKKGIRVLLFAKTFSRVSEDKDVNECKGSKHDAWEEGFNGKKYHWHLLESLPKN